MPSLLVHLALTGLIAAALLGEAFDRRSLAVLFGVTAFPDLDSFVALVSSVGHRAALHTVFVPLVGALVLLADLRVRETSYVRERWGPRGVRIAWVALLVYVLSAISLDLVDGVANPLWPLHDQYYHVDGKFEFSSERGIVQTFVDLGAGDAESGSFGSTDDLELDTGVNPREEPDGTTDRVFPVVRAGWELTLLLVGTVVTAVRFHVDQSVEDR